MPLIILKKAMSSTRIMGELIIFSLLISCSQQPTKEQSLNLFEEANSDSAIIFAPNLVSTHLPERDAALSPNSYEFYFSITSYTQPTIAFIQFENSAWSKPEVASFSGVYSDIEPHFSPDGNRLYFASNRPLIEGGELKDFDIWYVDKTDDDWGKPVNIGESVNTSANEFYPSVTKSGTLYWCAKRDGGLGGEDLYYAKLVDGKFTSAQLLPDSVNSVSDEYNAFVDPEERYIIFTSHGWGAGFGRGDLWISFRKPDQTWTRPINMGEKVNTQAFEFCPFVSHDGKYLFFTSDRAELAKKTPATYDEIYFFSLQLKNRLSNIYIINADIIEKLNPLNNSK
jgi:hypothetical protein